MTGRPSRDSRRWSRVAAVALGLAAFLPAPRALVGQVVTEADTGAPAPERTIRPTTVLAGVGTTMGVLGGQAEFRFGQSAWTGFVGLGYTPAIDQGDPSGVTPAAGIRWYFRSSEHGRVRTFAELSVAQGQVRGGTFEFSGGIPRIVDGARHFGPALEGGYRLTCGGGFVLLGAIGVGLRVDDDDRTSGRLNLAATIGVGLGL